MNSATDDFSDEEHARRLAEAQERVYTHPACIEHYEVAALAQAIFGVLIPNARELLGLLHAAETNEELAIELMQNVRAPTVREEWEARTIRALHNYVSSSASVVDHVRRVMRNRQGPIAERFEHEKRKAVEQPEMAFVRDLRNYTLHRSLPSLGYTLSMTRVHEESDEMEMKSNVYLHRGQLLAWDGWSAASKAFLRSLDDGEVPLFPIFETHINVMAKLNGGLCNALGEAIDYSQLNELTVEANAVLAGVDIETARHLTEQWTADRNDPLGSKFVDGRIQHAGDRDMHE